MPDLLIDNAVLATMGGGDGPAIGPAQADLGLVAQGALAIAGGRIAAIGRREDVLRAASEVGDAFDVLDVGGRLVLPGLVDAHTHLVWAGDRALEFERRLGGATYQDIMAEGGGIATTVRATRAATDEALLDGLMSRLDALLAHGVTTVEVKSGYGLSTEEELRHLRLIAEAGRHHPVRVVPTFLGAHAVPDEFRGRQDAYVAYVIDAMLPAIAAEFPSAFCDVFCDEGAFTRDQTARILTTARRLGLRGKVHSDEFANLGATALAAELGCVSADHLVAAGPADLDALARAGTVGVILPGTTVGLGSHRFADAREMVARGVPVALGSDHNPGTCPSVNLPLMMALAARYCGLRPAEAVVAATRNAAYAVGEGQHAGRLAVGRPADLAVVDTADYRDLTYRFGDNPAWAVMVGGRWVAPEGGPGATASLTQSL